MTDTSKLSALIAFCDAMAEADPQETEYLELRDAAVAEAKRIVEVTTALRDTAEEHRARYNIAAHDSETGTFQKQYWAGRRDEAGYFRDRIASLLDGDA